MSYLYLSILMVLNRKGIYLSVYDQWYMYYKYTIDLINKVFYHLFNRSQILENTRHKDLQYFIAMVDMLATCAEGENRFIESICQTIFKIPELLRILNNKKIIDNLKRPFLRFFLWVYLNTAGGMIESGAGDLPHDKWVRV